MTEALDCWQCGESLAELLYPFRRNDECPACRADVHVCRMCEFYDPTMGDSCREPVADKVNDKERANFCDYYRATPGAYRATEDAAARIELDALFGLESGGEPAGEAQGEESFADKRKAQADEARRKLDSLFGLDDETEP